MRITNMEATWRFYFLISVQWKQTKVEVDDKKREIRMSSVLLGQMRHLKS